MRPFLLVPAAALLASCLALPLMASVTSQTVSCPEGMIKQMGNGFGCVIPLKVRPPGSGGGSNTNDWGMCGVLNISATFDAVTVARVIVDTSGYYAVELVGNTRKSIPTLTETCVLFTDFKAVPAVSKASFLGPPFPSYTGGMKAGFENIKGSAGNACIWAGLSGNLETKTDAGWFGTVSAFFDGPETELGAQYVTSYAFCSGYSAPGWKEWHYFAHGGGYFTPTKVTSIGLNDAEDWCYIDFIESYLVRNILGPGPISAGLSLSGGNYSMNATPAGGIFMNYNCLPLKQ